jgi:hypothetical protein
MIMLKATTPLPVAAHSGAAKPNNEVERRLLAPIWLQLEMMAGG